MEKYTYSDVIIDPDDPRLEVGSKYYVSDYPKGVLEHANNNEGGYIGTLKSVDVKHPVTPFIVRYGQRTSQWACLIRKKELSYTERQAKWIANTGIKVGDKVRVTRKADSLEDGWQTRWNPDMDEAVGKIGTVSYVFANLVDFGIQVDVPDVGEFLYPYFILEKVEQKYVPYDFSDLTWRTFLLDKPVKARDGQSGPALVIGFSQLDGGMWLANVGGVAAVNAGALLDGWVFLDGTQCGKLVEE